ncbi:MAG TPA: PDZ domain-containing protein [Phycisphaerales bacterium]|nr:PDZ domain-containing protein [Phycisphaerales bacterium]
MMELNRRQSVVALVIAAGLAGCAADRTARACPPEEGSADPAQQQLDRTIVVSRPQGYGLTMPAVTTFNGDRLGSTYQTRIYRPAQALNRYNAKIAAGGEPTTLTLFADGDGPQRVLRVKENGRDIRVEERDGKIKATINGKAVDDDDVTVKNGMIEVRDGSGATVLKEEWPEMDVTVRSFRGVPAIAPIPPVPPVPPGITWPGVMEIETPKVMLGITMDNADDELVEQLGLPEGEYAVIQTVPEGLPAAKAGLQPKDIIVSIDGKSATGTEGIRDVMKGKAPGDKVALEVARQGSRVKLDVTLEAFDSKKFPAYAPTMAQGWTEKFGAEGFNKRVDVEALKDRLRMAVPRGGVGDPLLFVNPAEGTTRLQERLDAMESQLKRLEEMLKRLESRGTAPTPSGGPGNPTPCYAGT